MTKHDGTIKRGTCGIIALAMFALGTQGCSADAGAAGPTDDDRVASSDEALHAYPGVPALSWRGAPPQAVQQNTNQPGLQLTYSIDVGVTDKTIVGLQACWYTPSNPNNLYTQGDPIGCTIVGKPKAGKWHHQQCPGDQVVHGYTTRANSSNSKIATFSTMCRSLSNPGVYSSFDNVGDTNILFPDILSCPDRNGSPAYMEYFSANPNFTGFNGVCVLR